MNEPYKRWEQVIPEGMEIPISDPEFSAGFDWKRITVGNYFLGLIPLRLYYDTKRPCFAQRLKDRWEFLKDWNRVSKLSKRLFKLELANRSIINNLD